MLERKRAKLGRYKKSLAEGAGRQQDVARYGCLSARLAMDSAIGAPCGSGLQCPMAFDCVKATEETNTRWVTPRHWDRVMLIDRYTLPLPSASCQ